MLEEAQKAKIEKSRDINPEIYKIHNNKANFYKMINSKITNDHRVSEFDVEYKNEKIPAPHHYEAQLQ